MLTAFIGRERLIAPKVPGDHLRALSRRRELRCPACDAEVIYRAGARKIAHFAHRPGADCPLERDPDTGPESETHLAIKLRLFDRLSTVPGALVELEAALPGAGRRADLLLSMGGRRLAVEVQCSSISGASWRERHETYRAAGIADVWILAGPPPDAAVIPASPRHGLPASFRLPLRDLAATILAAEGELLFGWTGPRAGNDLYAALSSALPPAPTYLAAASALASHHRVLTSADGNPAPWDRTWIRSGITLSARYLHAAPLAALRLDRDGFALRIDDAHEALAREAARRDGLAVGRTAG